jgi:hypothetical protein
MAKIHDPMPVILPFAKKAPPGLYAGMELSVELTSVLLRQAKRPQTPACLKTLSDVSFNARSPI